jgi:hypothetical protein
MTGMKLCRKIYTIMVGYRNTVQHALFQQTVVLGSCNASVWRSLRMGMEVNPEHYASFRLILIRRSKAV